MDGWSLTQRFAAGRLSGGLYEMMLDSDKAAIVLDGAERIVAVNEKWQSLCGFAPSEALHASPKILQGELTNQEKAHAFAHELRTTGEARTTLANYTKGGEPFAHIGAWIRPGDGPARSNLGHVPSRHSRSSAQERERARDSRHWAPSCA
jgi:PAS domain-containing protein